MPLLTLVSPDVLALQRKDAGFSRVCFRFAHIYSINGLVSERTGPILKSDLGSGPRRVSCYLVISVTLNSSSMKIHFYEWQGGKYINREARSSPQFSAHIHRKNFSGF